MARILDVLARLWPGGTKPASEEKASRAGALVAFDTMGQPIWTPRDYAAFAREGYMQNAIVYRAVRLIAEAAASAPLLLYEGDEEIAAHPLLDLLARPSADQTGTDFLESWYAFLLVSGNAYVEAVAVGGELRELHALRPDRMKVVPGADGWPEAYEYSAGGRRVLFDSEPVPGVRPVLHLKLFHPAHDHYGLSPIEAAANAIDIHNTAGAWNKALLDNSARPSGALVYAAGSGRMTGEQFERLKSELETSYMGAKQAGRPLLLEGGLDWKPLSLSPKDMDFIEAKNSAAREIALAIGVPPMLLGIPGDNTYSNYQEAQRALWRNTVLPLVQRTGAAMAAWLAPAWGGDLKLKPDIDQIGALSLEREALWARIEQSSFITLNEKRAAVGYGPVDGGDSIPGTGEPLAALNSGPGGADLPLPFAKFSPDQARVPRGDPEGGQWTDGGAGNGAVSSGGADNGRVISDATPENFTKPGTQLAQAGGRSGYPIDILEEDQAGGHTFERHVNKSEEYLKARVLENRVNIPRLFGAGRKRAGSFASLEAANKLINSTISDPVNKQKLDAFAAGSLLFPLPVLYLHKDFAAPTGIEAYALGDRNPEMRGTYGVTVRILRSENVKNGYYIESAWPTNRD